MLLSFPTGAFVVGAAGALALAGSLRVVAGDAMSGDAQPVVVATMSIWADIVDQVDCHDHFDVQTLIPAGGDPHSYEPSMSDRDTLADSALVVANGADLEAQLHDTLDSVAGDGTVVFEMADHVTTRPMTEADPSDDHEGDDPHIWFDPTLIAEGLPALGDALVTAGAESAEIDACVTEVTDRLTNLDLAISETLNVVPEERRLLVTNHDALGYFAHRYRFEIVGSVLPSSSTLVEASPAELDDLSDAIEDAGVPAIFAEALESTDDATALGDRLGVDVVTLYTDSLGDEGSGAETYADMILFDANAIATALAPSRSE